MKAGLAKISLVFLLLIVGCTKDAPKPNPAVLPSVVTGVASDITDVSAVVGGEVTSDGNATVTARGIVYATTPGPTIASTVVSADAGTGTFTATLAILFPATTYYARAYATNSAGTNYGLEISFLTASKPTLTTKSIIKITGSTAESGGNVVSDGGAPVTARGICWSTSVNPGIGNNKTTDGSGLGSFTSAITGLSTSNTYYVRAYATNATGTAYGEQMSFTTDCTAFEGTISYVTVVTAAIVPFTPCLPSISGTTTFTHDAPGIYSLGDASFGQYACAWSDSPAVGVKWEVNCSNHVVTTGNDQYSLLWNYSIVSNNGTSLVVSWTSSYGDAGTSTLTRMGGWPLNLSF